MMMTTEDSMQYDESYGAYEEGYDEGAYYQEGQEGAGGAGMEYFEISYRAPDLAVLARHWPFLIDGILILFCWSCW